MITFPYHQYHPIIDDVITEMYKNDPTLERYGEKGKAKCREDNEHHFHHLETAYQLNNSMMFVDYAMWLNGILKKHGMETKHLVTNFQLILKYMKNRLEKEKEDTFVFYLQEAIILLEEHTANKVE